MEKRIIMKILSLSDVAINFGVDISLHARRSLKLLYKTTLLQCWAKQIMARLAHTAYAISLNQTNLRNKAVFTNSRT